MPIVAKRSPISATAEFLLALPRHQYVYLRGQFCGTMGHKKDRGRSKEEERGGEGLALRKQEGQHPLTGQRAANFRRDLEAT